MHQKFSVLIILLLTVLILGCGEKKTQPVKKAPPTEPQFVATVKMMDSMYCASIAKMGPYSDAGKTMMELMTWMTKNKAMMMGVPFGIYYDDPAKVKPESTRYEICMPVPIGTKGDKQVMVKKIGPAQIASTIYVGPYDKVGPTYQKLMNWIMENNYEIVGAPYEFYLTSPEKVPAESLKTEVAFPVKQKATAQPTGTK